MKTLLLTAATVAAVASIATGCQKDRNATAEPASSAVPSAASSSAAPLSASDAGSTTAKGRDSGAALATASGNPSSCTKLAWTDGDFAEAKGKKLTGTLKLENVTNSDKKKLRIGILVLDTPLCARPKSDPDREVQVGESDDAAKYASLAGKHVDVPFGSFMLSRSDAVHFRDVVGILGGAPTVVGAAGRACDSTCMYNGRCARIQTGNGPCCEPITKSVLDDPKEVENCQALEKKFGPQGGS